MRKATLAGFGLALVFAVSGCGGDSFDSLTKEEIKLMDEKAAVLETVKDKETAEKAKTKIEEINKKKKELGDRRGKLVKKDKEAQALADMLKAEEKNKDAGEKASKRLAEAKKKLAENKEAAKVLEGVDLN